MNRYRVALATILVSLALRGQQPTLAPKTIGEADCSAEKLGTTIPPAAIGEPVSAITLATPQWHAEPGGMPAYCSIQGSIAPVDKAAPPFRFEVALPATWTLRAAQFG